MKDTKQRLLEMMEYLNPDFAAGYKPIFLYETIQPADLNKILDGYIEAALWTEQERLSSEANSLHNITGRDEDYYDEEDETETEKRFLRIMRNKEQKTIESFSREDIEPDSLISAYKDIKRFIELAGDDAVNTAVTDFGYEQLGHDIWLTRNGHGAGFFDRSYDMDVEKKLMDAAKALKEEYIYVNDNMKLSFESE